MGATMRQGPHQTAQKSTMLRPGAPVTSWKFWSVTSTTFALSAIALPSPCGGRSAPGGLASAATCISRKNLHPLRQRRRMTGRALDHVGIAVHSLDDSLPVFESITGGKGY